MASVDYLKQFDKRQLFRFFVDGRFHKKYDGWVKYDEREKGSVQAMMNGFSFMMDNLHRQESGLNAMYLLQLHRVCMLHVETTNPKTAPGDIRYLRNSMPFFVKTTTLEHIQEVLEMRIDDGTLVFNDKEIRKTANELNAKDVFALLQKTGKLSYRPWYPNLDTKTLNAIEGKSSLSDFYDAKHYVQKVTVQKIEEIVHRYNLSINIATNNDSKLRAIALIVRELEMLHSFSDGNCRTFAGVLLNQLLIYNDFYPSMPYNPNLDGEYSLSQWIDEIKKGMEQTKILLKDPSAVVYNYTIDDMPKQKQDIFLDMALEFIKKIDDYNEVFLTPVKLSKYTKGIWHNYEKNMTFNGVGNSKGNIAFFTAINDLKKVNKSVTQELNKMVRNGVRAIVIDDESFIDGLKLPIFVVDDILTAYEEISANIRQDVNPKTILITGTEGKTGTKIQSHHLFDKQTKVHAILNSANAKIPVLRTMANLEKDHKYEIVEFSVDANEDKTIKGAKLVNPDICFFTNIGKEHMHNHKEIDGVIQAKSAVVMGMRKNGICIINSSIEVYDKFVLALNNRKKDLKILSYGVKDTDTAILLNSKFDTEALVWNIEANIDGVDVKYKLPLVQNHAPLMSIGILLAVKISGLDVIRASRDYESIKPFESMGLIHKINIDDEKVLFYDQSRRASISGIRSAFKDLKNFNPKGKIVAFLGSISSVNENEWTKEYQEELAQLINDNPKISKLYTTGANMKFTYDNLDNKNIHIMHSDDYNSLYRYIHSELKSGDLLFVMGYMRLQMDKFAKMVLDNKLTSPFKSDILKYNLSDDNIKEYKELIILSQLDKKIPSYIISNYINTDIDTIEKIKVNSLSFREYRMNLLFSFFNDVNLILEKDYSMKSLNNEMISSGNDTYIFNSEFCNYWFNNIDKLVNTPKKQLFGTFYKIDNSDKYFLFVIVGTTNLHIGLGKYSKNGDKIEMLKLTKDDHDDINKIYGLKLQKFGIDFKSRSWGNQWVTIDCGGFINVINPNIYKQISNLKNSELYKNKFKVLLDTLGEK